MIHTGAIVHPARDVRSNRQTDRAPSRIIVGGQHTPQQVVARTTSGIGATDVTYRGRTLSALAIVAIVAFAMTPVVSAHGDLESSNPESGSTIPVAPERVSARFSEEVDPDGSS